MHIKNEMNHNEKKHSPGLNWRKVNPAFSKFNKV